MTAGLQREFEPQTIRSGTTYRTHTPIKCSKCPNEFVFESAKRLPDEVLNKKFTQLGWLVSRDRNHHVCPRCLGVRPENRLAAKFKVSSDGQAVPTPGECAIQAGRARDQRNATTAQLIAKHFPPKAAASSGPIPTPPSPVPMPPPEPDQRVGVLEREISELRAANELQLETTGEILKENRRTNEMLEVSLRQNAQMIEAIARMASTTGRQNECLLASVGQAANALSRMMEIAQDRAAPMRELQALPAPTAPPATAVARPTRVRVVPDWAGLSTARARREARRRPVLFAAE